MWEAEDRVEEDGEAIRGCQAGPLDRGRRSYGDPGTEKWKVPPKPPRGGNKL